MGGRSLSTRTQVVKSLYATYGRGAEKRGLGFHLPFSYFWDLIETPCIYCGVNFSMSKAMQVSGEIVNFTYNGVDRIDSGKDYDKDNCVPCCKECNKMKLDMPIELFLLRVRDIFNHSVLTNLFKDYVEDFLE